MTMRTISKTIAFTRPFTPAGFNSTQPAGSYRVETDAPKGPSNNTAELDKALLDDAAASAPRFESRARRLHRRDKKLFFDTRASEKIVYPGATNPGTDR